MTIHVSILMLTAAAATIAASSGTGWPQPRAQTNTPPETHIFMEIAPVFQHRRCMNCHVLSPFPRQGENGRRHMMSIAAGDGGRGSPGLPCTTCHRGSNSPSGVPGAEGWHLAPLKMGWEGLSAGEICRALRDPARSGMTPHQLIQHLTHDKLVLWAWQGSRDLAGKARSTPPLSHAAFLDGIRRWLAAGGGCPH